MNTLPFTGSYTIDDVEILLKVIDVPDTPIAEKERQIQQENRHYSEMLSHEHLPSQQYIHLFHQAMQDNQQHMALDCLNLAAKITTRRKNDIVLVSLARAGTPVGVILKHTLNRYYQKNAVHYSISIIRDRGIDENALHYILKQHAAESIVFIDGWTGKGVIARELKTSIDRFNQQFNTNMDSGLYVLVDLAGVAKVTASSDDYLIPSSILNATLSGLISRSILNSDYINNTDFHGCVYYQKFQSADLSSWFITKLVQCIDQHWQQGFKPNSHNIDIQTLQQQSKKFIRQTKSNYQISHENRIKPGIGESTRVLLRRVPDIILLKDKQDKAVAHLQALALEKHVAIIYQADLPYRAVALIKDVT